MLFLPSLFTTQIDFDFNDPTEALKKLLEYKKKTNPSYSLSALARDLQISQPHLVKIINGKQKLSPHHAYKIAKYLRLSDEKLLQFLKLTLD